jgi:TRAP-type C4-dicarboxylate transport system permease small subunit
MTIATLNWPEASIYIALIAAVALVVSVLIWSIFRTGQTAITSDSRKQEASDERRMTAGEA